MLLSHMGVSHPPFLSLKTNTHSGAWAIIVRRRE